MMRREAILARSEGRKENKLLESDYLLGVYDQYRLGGLRFKLDPNGDFLDNNRAYTAPPWTSIRELEQASMALEKDEEQNNPHCAEWIKMLIAPGGSLGGARPNSVLLVPLKLNEKLIEIDNMSKKIFYSFPTEKNRKTGKLIHEDAKVNDEVLTPRLGNKKQGLYKPCFLFAPAIGFEPMTK